MRRGRNHRAPVSLFAFQDVMASVIGVLFFVVLLMALDIVNKKTMGAPPIDEPVSEDQLKSLRGKLASLKEEAGRLSQVIKKHTQSINRASTDERETLTEIQGLNARLKSLHARIEQDDNATVDLTRNKQLKQSEYRKAKEELARLERLAAALRKARRSARPAANIAYIIDRRGDNLEPWLLEVSKDSLRVSSRDGTTALLDFEGASHESRTEQFLAWAENQNRSTHYFMLIIKPSGFELSQALRERLKKLGFDRGTDLIPENWRPF